MPTILYGQADVARAIGVTRATVSNWYHRHRDDIPPPDFITADNKRPYWLSLGPWAEWYSAHIEAEYNRSSEFRKVDN